MKLKLFSLIVGIVVCTMLTACPDHDPDPKPIIEETEEVNPVSGTVAREWVLTAQSITDSNGQEEAEDMFTYDAVGRLTSRIDKLENSVYNFDYTSSRVVISGTERCSYTLNNGLITSGGYENATFKYDLSNHLISATDNDYRTTLKWIGNRLVSMEVIDPEHNEYALAVKFKYRKANDMHPDCCRVFNSLFFGMMPQGYMTSELCAAGLFGEVPTEEVITGFEPLYDFIDPEEQSLDIYYLDNYGNGRPSEARFVYPDGTLYYSYTWGKI